MDLLIMIACLIDLIIYIVMLIGIFLIVRYFLKEYRKIEEDCAILEDKVYYVQIVNEDEDIKNIVKVIKKELKEDE